MALRHYVQVARPDHWFKNVFALPGMFLALAPVFGGRGLRELMEPQVLVDVAVAAVALCFVASSNYVINEWLDAARDREHPEKQMRPAACGKVTFRGILVSWLLLTVAGLGLGFAVNPGTGLCLVVLWVMGLAYNIPPVRTKELAYVDVLSEAVNNPLRLGIGWYAIRGDMDVLPPPLSVIVAYWMFGSFLMAVKRLAEYRMIGDPTRAAAYRNSFRYYNEERLLESMMFYASLFAMMAGVFIVRYRFEEILALPACALCLAYYTHLGFKPNSPVQHPERLVHQRKLMLLVAVTVAISAALLFVDMAFLENLFAPLIEPKQ